ncbi:MAG TPA: dihydrodipicolinate synthase family protein [Acidimicrobiia bacterium]|nr:dihydrodipicolinate synthase family protein [Acidimicrobiia bacterium]
MTAVPLPTRSGAIDRYQLGRYPRLEIEAGRPRTRRAYAAAHVVADPLGDPVGTSAIDWESTLGFRRHLWSLGFGVAEAMDTAQRGMGLDLEAVRTLIDRSIAEAAAENGEVVCGINTDELSGPDHTLDTIGTSYLDQLEFVESRGGSAVMMASRALAAAARGPEDYAAVYSRVLGQAGHPVILHWLGPMFDPALEGYWGSTDPTAAMESLMSIVADNPERVDGVKISMLDADLEVEFRRRLPEGVRCYTGDDFNFPDLIAGDAAGHSDALLGIFDGIAPVAATAFHALDRGDTDEFRRILAPTVPLSRHIFEAPTFHYKTGLVFLAYLNGHQDHFRMVGGQEGARSIVHLAELVRLADAAGLLPDPSEVARRLQPVLAAAGIH